MQNCLALRGQICGIVTAESPGSPKADSNVEQQLGVFLMKEIMREGLEFLHLNVPVHLQIK